MIAKEFLNYISNSNKRYRWHDVECFLNLISNVDKSIDGYSLSDQDQVTVDRLSKIELVELNGFNEQLPNTIKRIAFRSRLLKMIILFELIIISVVGMINNFYLLEYKAAIVLTIFGVILVIPPVIYLILDEVVKFRIKIFSHLIELVKTNYAQQSDASETMA